MTNNTACAASVKKRVWLSVGGLVAAAGVTVGVFAMAGGGDQQDRALVHTDQDSSHAGQSTRTRAAKVAPTSSSAEVSSSTAAEEATDGATADPATTTPDTATTEASVSATAAATPGGKAATASSGGTSTGAAAGSPSGSPGGGSTSSGTTGGAAIAPPVTQAPAPPPPPPAPAAAQCTAGGANANAAAVAQRFCDHRASRGLAVMSRSSRLDAAAQNRAQQMANAGALDHAGYEGLVWGACASCTGVGENLANFSTVGDAWSFWLGSSMHTANLNHPGGGEFGVGAVTGANGTTFFVHLFGWY